MSIVRTPNRLSLPDLDNTEMRMRRALGVQDGNRGEYPQPAQKQERRPRRFVRDGEVSVVLVNSRKDPDAAPSSRTQIEAIEAALHAERTHRENVQHALQEAQATIQALQTKLAHAEMAHSEALAAERRARELAENALQEALAGREAAEQQLRALTAGKPRSAPQEVEAVPLPRKRGRPPGSGKAARSTQSAAKTREPKSAKRTREPKPIKWWLSSSRER